MNVLNDLESYRHVSCGVFDDSLNFGDFFRMNELNGISIIHLNIRSYKKNFDEFLVLLNGMNVKFDVIVLTETWMDGCESVVCLNGYSAFSTSSRFNQNDGSLCGRCSVSQFRYRNGKTKI
jgi:hypothetical protein